MKTLSKIKTAILPVAAVAMLSACSMTPANNTASYEDGISDPLESVNRAVFSFNRTVDNAVIHPTLRGYRAVVPRPAREGLTNVLRNLKSPVELANELLQGDLDSAATVAIRAIVNTLIGVGGIVDVAAHEGIAYEHEDFGQTLGFWGVPQGPYLVVPLFGPTTLRDGTGVFVDALADPLRLYFDNVHDEHWQNWRMAGTYVNLRNEMMDVLEQLEYGAIDYYATVRSAYHQNREAMVNDKANNGDMTLTAEIPFYDNEDF